MSPKPRAGRRKHGSSTPVTLPTLTPRQIQQRAKVVKQLRLRADFEPVSKLRSELQKAAEGGGAGILNEVPLLGFVAHVSEDDLPLHVFLCVDPKLVPETRAWFLQRLKAWITRLTPAWVPNPNLGQCKPKLLPQISSARVGYWQWNLVNGRYWFDYSGGHSQLSYIVETPAQWKELWLMWRLSQRLTLADLLNWDRIDPPQPE